MVTLESRTEVELGSEASRTIREFQLTLRWVMDPDLRHWLDDEEWGNLILLVALIGKQRFIEARRGDGRDREAFSEAYRVWTMHRTASKNVHEPGLEEQFELSVRKRMIALLEWRQPRDPADFLVYLLERDTVEFFLLGCEGEGMGRDFRSEIGAADAAMRELLLGEILPELRSNLRSNGFGRIAHPLLPDSFWWRNLPLSNLTR